MTRNLRRITWGKGSHIWGQNCPTSPVTRSFDACNFQKIPDALTGVVDELRKPFDERISAPTNNTKPTVER